MEATVPFYLLTREQLLALGLTDVAINNLPSINIDSKLQDASKAVPSNSTENRSANEVSRTEVKLNDLPELPFELILDYLGLKERINCKAVSRRWYQTIDRLKVKSLCFSKHERDRIFEKGKWISGVFEKNFIRSPKFKFFSTFCQSIFSNLKHLRLCDLRPGQ